MSGGLRAVHILGSLDEHIGNRIVAHIHHEELRFLGEQVEPRRIVIEQLGAQGVNPPVSAGADFGPVAGLEIEIVHVRTNRSHILDCR